MVEGVIGGSGGPKGLYIRKGAHYTQRRIEMKLGEVVGRTLRWGDKDELQITIVPPFALGCVRGRSMS